MSNSIREQTKLRTTDGIELIVAAEEGAWRIHRLHSVIKFLTDKTSGVDQLAKLEDYKGILTCTWKNSIPERSKIEAVGRAWEEIGNEPPENVEHATEEIDDSDSEDIDDFDFEDIDDSDSSDNVYRRIL